MISYLHISEYSETDVVVLRSLTRKWIIQTVRACRKSDGCEKRSNIIALIELFSKNTEWRCGWCWGEYL